MPKNSGISNFDEVDFAVISDEQIIFLRTQLEKELKKRKIKFTTGEIGKIVAINHFNSTKGLVNLQRIRFGTKTIDAVSREGERYSIKTIKDGKKTGTVYPDENKNKILFEYLLLVSLNDDYQLKSLYRFSWNQFATVRKWDKTMNAWYVPMTQNSISQAECIYERD
jgi:hypothetical protein